MRVVHLLASPFFGGPERQMLGLARYLPGDVESIYLSFAERGLAAPFMAEVHRQGYQGKILKSNAPRILAAAREIAEECRRLKADILVCSGYKPDIIGWRAARSVGIPVVGVSHGWTAATWKVRCYEAIDRWVSRRMDAVVCVSHAQAEKVRLARVPDAKIVVIQNAIGTEAFVDASPANRAELESWFAQPPRLIVGAAGRFSPEKGFAVLVDAAAQVIKTHADVGFVLFGDGPLRGDIERAIAEHRLHGRFVLAGFRDDLHRFLPNLDLGVMSSFTEGLPVILLETDAAGVPSVATAVGGIPEVIDDGVSGCLVPAGDSRTLADRLNTLLGDDTKRLTMGQAARLRVRNDFSFEAMGKRYHELFRRLTQASP